MNSAVKSGSGFDAFFGGTMALAKRELIRFLRQPTRLVGAIGQPVVFWILFGAGLGGSFKAPEWAAVLERPLTYQEYFLPGVAVLIVMFTAIFSTISIIEDRREGFLQGVLAAPVPRSVIVMGKVLGGAGMAVMQAVVFLLVAPLLSFVGLSPGLQIEISFTSGLLAVAFLGLIAVELTALGVVIAWPMSSTQGFHAIMSIFLMPMWLVSGAFFPGDGTGWLSWIIRINPLTYGVAGLRRLIYDGQLPSTAALPSMLLCVLVTLGFTILYMAVAVALVNRPGQHNVT
ncbi:MAG: ABC transporter permease [Planctomycetaceae bacterium]|nr:ABC transporter permease [Planctomycetaceae bacterium]